MYKHAIISILSMCFFFTNVLYHVYVYVSVFVCVGVCWGWGGGWSVKVCKCQPARAGVLWQTGMTFNLRFYTWTPIYLCLTQTHSNFPHTYAHFHKQAHSHICILDI